MRELPEKSLPIINEIVEKLSSIRLSCYEFNIIMAVIRKTYGWDKKNDWISGSQLEKQTGIKSCHCYRTITKLIKKNILYKTEQGFLGLNKHTIEWVLPKQVLPKQVLPKQVLPKQVLPKQVLPKQDSNTTQTGSLPLPKQVYTKDTITKDNIQKTIVPKGTTTKVDRRDPEIDLILTFLKQRVGVDDFKESKFEQRKWGRNMGFLGKKLGKEEFARRLRLILDEPFKQKNCGSLRFIYKEIKGFIEPVNNSITI